MKKAMCISAAAMAAMFLVAPASWANTTPFQVMKVGSGGTAVTFKDEIAKAYVVGGNHYHEKLLGGYTVLIMHTGHNLHKKAVLYVLQKGEPQPATMVLEPANGSSPHVYDYTDHGA